MKMLSTFRHRRLIFAGMLLLALSFGALDQLFLSAPLRAQTPPPAPSGAVNEAAKTDKDTGKIVTTASGLKYVELVEGPGAAVKSGDDIMVNYEGKLSDGTKFDSSYDRGKPFEVVVGVGKVIPGWDEGLVGMKVGGKRKLIVPPLLAYGPGGYANVIPPNATLTFVVEIVSIKAK